MTARDLTTPGVRESSGLVGRAGLMSVDHAFVRR